MMDKKLFFDAIRKDFSLTTGNVAGFDVILDEGFKRGTFIKDLAYILATAWWETAHTMQPVREAYWLSESWRKSNLRYYPHYGRGYVQLTWPENYARASKEIGVDLTTDLDKALEPSIAVQILFKGMEEGWFTKKKLTDYIIRTTNQTYTIITEEFKQARKIINGTDKDDEIAALATKLYKALQKANYKPEVQSVPIVVETPVQSPVAQPEPITGTIELILRKGDLSKVTLEDFYLALKTLYGDK